MQLQQAMLRVLGALLEKEITTPELYPLSLNALVNACNQRSSREPVMNLSEAEVREALDTLALHGLASSVRDARVPKFQQHARTVFNLRRDETAVICLLLLRGPQTPGELRSRADRLFPFDDLAAVQSALDRLARREGLEPATAPLVRVLLRQPGSREVRFVHLLGDAPEEVDHSSAPNVDHVHHDRVTELETEVAALRQRVEQIEERIAHLKH